MLKLWYHVDNNGDGSASVHFNLNEKNATKADEKQTEGFAESTVGSVEFAVRGGKLFFRHTADVWREVENPDIFIGRKRRIAKKS